MAVVPDRDKASGGEQPGISLPSTPLVDAVFGASIAACALQLCASVTESDLREALDGRSDVTGYTLIQGRVPLLLIMWLVMHLLAYAWLTHTQLARDVHRPHPFSIVVTWGFLTVAVCLPCTAAVLFAQGEGVLSNVLVLYFTMVALFLALLLLTVTLRVPAPHRTLAAVRLAAFFPPGCLATIVVKTMDVNDSKQQLLAATLVVFLTVAILFPPTYAFCLRLPLGYGTDRPPSIMTVTRQFFQYEIPLERYQALTSAALGVAVVTPLLYFAIPTTPSEDLKEWSALNGSRFLPLASSGAPILFIWTVMSRLVHATKHVTVEAFGVALQLVFCCLLLVFPSFMASRLGLHPVTADAGAVMTGAVLVVASLFLLLFRTVMVGLRRTNRTQATCIALPGCVGLVQMLLVPVGLGRLCLGAGLLLFLGFLVLTLVSTLLPDEGVTAPQLTQQLTTSTDLSLELQRFEHKHRVGQDASRLARGLPAHVAVAGSTNASYHVLSAESKAGADDDGL